MSYKYFTDNGDSKPVKEYKHTKTAIKHSINKWKEVLRFIDEFGFTPTGAMSWKNCALCAKFWANQCPRCPFNNECPEVGAMRDFNLARLKESLDVQREKAKVVLKKLEELLDG